MQRNLPLSMGSLAAIVAAVLLIAVGSPESSYAAGMDAMSIDMNTSGNSATELGTLESCARINENNIQDADETAEDTLTIDVTALNIPASDPMIAFAYAFEFPSASIQVVTEDPNWLLGSLAGSNVFPASDPLPDNSSPWNSSAVDTGDPTTTAESGSGVLDRLTIQTFPGSVSGQFLLKLTGNGHVNAAGVGQAAVATNYGRVAVNQDCGAVMGDVDCSYGTQPVTAGDALKILRKVASLPVTQNEPCQDIGTGGPPVQGNVDCSVVGNPVSATDALKILRKIVTLPVTQNEPCADIGTLIGT